MTPVTKPYAAISDYFYLLKSTHTVQFLEMEECVLRLSRCRPRSPELPVETSLWLRHLQAVGAQIDWCQYSRIFLDASIPLKKCHMV